MPLVKLCAMCRTHNATNYRLAKGFRVPELNRSSTVNAGSIDLCDDCWNRYVNKKTLTLEGVQTRIEVRTQRILERALEQTEQPPVRPH